VNVRVVAVQPRVKVGEVDENLRHLEDLITQAAREHSPQMILLPESMTTPNVYHPSMRAAARPVDGEPMQMLRRLAREHGCLVGGGYLSVRGEDARGTYCLAEPDGTTHLHDKDQPSFWENNYYGPGHDDGIMPTSLGPLGCMNGWEWGRSRTAERLRGRVLMGVGGMHFPSFPTWPLVRPWFIGREEELLIGYAREMPVRMAKILGVPCVQPSHVGDVTMHTPLVPGLPWHTRLLGETHIVDADGRTLALMTYRDGEGYVAADVQVGEPRPRDEVPGSFWISAITPITHLVWWVGNAHGRSKYLTMKALRRHRWQ
jgi:predicted amidohydrolase